LNRAKQNSKNKKLKYDLDESWIEELLSDGRCAASGMEFVYDKKPQFPWQPSIDRITPSKGYLKDNCQLVCFSYNTLKGIGTHEEVLFIAKALLSNSNEKKDLNKLLTKYLKDKNKFFDNKKFSAGQKRRRTNIGRAESIFHSIKNSVKRRGFKRRFMLTIDKDWILEKLEYGVCEVTGLKFDNLGEIRALFLPSIDRINSKVGYTDENCQAVLYGYNAAKNVNTHEDVLKLARALVGKD
jgi:hypothetical protein